MKFIWNGQGISGQTAYQGTAKAKDVRLIPGHEVELPDDDPILNTWINRHLESGKLARVEETPKPSAKPTTKTEVKA